MASLFTALPAGTGNAALRGAARALLQVPLPEGDVVDVPQDQTPDPEMDMELNSGDAAWMMTCTALVLMMSIPGLSLFYGGLVRPKNVLSVLNNVFVCVAIVTIVWLLYGYSIAFSTENMYHGSYNINSFFGTLRHGGMSQIGVFTSTGNYPGNVFVCFHLMFAIITTALITGAFAERMKITAVWIFSALWATLVYCPLAHQVWGGDGAMLHSLGAIDFAGGIVVHISSGVSGVVAAVMIGKRIGYPRIPKAPHSLVLTHIGGSLLWVGWFGFNAGSATAADFLAGQAMIVTQAASAAGVIGWTVVELSCYKRPSTLGMTSGAIAGLVGITPASGSVGVMGALFIGFATGCVCFFMCTYVKDAINKYDDSLDVFGIHGSGGIMGALLVALFCAPELGGMGYGTVVMSGGEDRPIDNVGTQLAVQLASIIYAVVWAAVATWLILKVVDALHGGPWHPLIWRLKHLRSSEKEEEVGLDDASFTEQGYNFYYEDLNISVEVGPLRGRKGHGLMLYYTDDEGTRHPIQYQTDRDESLYEPGAAHGGPGTPPLGDHCTVTTAADVLNVDPESRARGAKGKAAAAIAAAAVSDSEDSDGETKEGSVHDRVARSLYKEGGVVAMKTNKDGKITAAAKAAKDAKDAAAPATLNGNGNVEERGDSAKQASSRV